MNDQSWQFGEGNEYLSLDFSRCQRPDGTFYGTGGQCRKGVQAPPKEKNPAKGRKPVDSAMLGKMSDKQLGTLMSRKELDTDQKAAISKELQDRRNAALNADKSGNSARTADAEAGKTPETALLSKAAGGGYLKQGGVQVEDGDLVQPNGNGIPVSKVTKAMAKEEMMESYRFGMNRDQIEFARETGRITPQQSGRLERMLDSEGGMRAVQTAPVVRDAGDPGNNLGGYKMGINGNKVNLTKTIYGNYVVTMDD